MIIKELVIYGYGKFQNKHVYFPSDQHLHVIYGENEAGKSTTMSFIQSVLFGFPTKQQAENRYEPRNSAKYGGRIHIKTSKYGELIIERVAGKATGEVFIYFEDGTVKGEDFLIELLGDVDKTAYMAIFSFNIHGLQHVNRLNHTEIGRFLFLSSMYGSDALFYLDDQLSRQQDEIFKRSGRKPALNDALINLQHKYDKLTEAKRKVMTYENLVSDKQKLEEELQTLIEEKKELHTELKRAEKIYSLLPVIREKKWCDKELSKLIDVNHFPSNGLVVLEQFEQGRKQIEEQIYHYDLKIKQLTEESETINVQDRIINSEHVLNELKANLSLYKERKNTHSHRLTTLENLEKEIALYKMRLYRDLTDDEILQIEATIPIKETLKKSVFEYRHLMENKAILDEQFEAAKNGLEESEAKVNELRDELLKADQREEMEAEVQKINENQLVAADRLKKEYEQTINDLNDYEQVQKQKKKTQYISLSILFLIGIGWTFMNEYRLLTVLLLCGMIVVFYFMEKNNDPFIKRLMKRKNELDEQLKGKQTLSFEDRYSKLQSLLSVDDHIRQMIKREEIEIKHFEKAYERIINKYEEWESQCFRNEKHIRNIVINLRLNEDYSLETVLESFEYLQEIQQKILKRNEFKKEVEMIAIELENFEHTCSELAKTCSIQGTNIEEMIYIVDQLISKEKQLQARKKQLRERIIELEEEYSELSNKRSYFLAEETKLFEHAKCNDANEFRQLGKTVEYREQLVKQKALLERQLDVENDINIKEIIQNETVYELVQIEELKNKLDRLALEEQNKLKQLSMFIVQIEELEQSGTYSDLRYAIEQDLTVVKELARKWAVFTLAKDLLMTTIASHREHKLPKLLEQAEVYFSFLTDSSYKGIFLPDKEETFIVERSDGVRFHPEELSQATAEQLYVALRFALVKSVQAEMKIPIIIDDSFVNFDHDRTGRVIDLLYKLMSEQQIIFFTCHKHLLDRFKVKPIEM